MKTKTFKLIRGMGLYKSTAYKGATFSSCCGATFNGVEEWDTYGKRGTKTTGRGIVLYPGEPDLPVTEKEQLHRVKSKNGTFTLALRKN